MNGMILTSTSLPELKNEYKKLEQLFFQGIEEYKSYEEIHPLFSKMRDVHQQINNIQANDFGSAGLRANAS